MNISLTANFPAIFGFAKHSYVCENYKDLYI